MTAPLVAARRQLRRRVGLLVAVSAGAIVTLAAGAAAAAEMGPVRLIAAFGPDAQLGAPTVLNVDLRVDLRRAPSPITEMQLFYPQRIGITTSGLGIASCVRDPADFVAVSIDGFDLAGCPRNAVLGRGLARAQVRLGDPGEDPEVIPERGGVAILSGGIRDGRLQLVALVRGDNPIGATLAYAGEARPAPEPYGDSLWIRVPPLPLANFPAVVALQRLTVALGDVTYYETPGDHTTAYRPDGIHLPSRCPRGGFRFAVRLRLADGRQLDGSTTVPCPRPKVPAPRRANVAHQP